MRAAYAAQGCRTAGLTARAGECAGREVRVIARFLHLATTAGGLQRYKASQLGRFGAKSFRPAVFAPAARSCSPANRQQWQSRLAEALRQLSSLLGRLQPWLVRGPGTAAPQRSIQ